MVLGFAALNPTYQKSYVWQKDSNPNNPALDETLLELVSLPPNG
jgi:hypothetical protein